METVLDSAADHYRHLGTSSLCSGYAIECLISLEKYRASNGGSSLPETVHECKAFIQYTIAALREEQAPYSIRRIYREILANKEIDRNSLLEGWLAVDAVISKIEQRQRPEEKSIVDSINFLKRSISQFTDISEGLEKKLYASSWSTRGIV